MNPSPDSTRSASTRSLGRFSRHGLSSLKILAALVISVHPLADELARSPQALDGMSFKSALGPMGQPADTDDLLVFEEGYFVSEECARRCGYAKVEYWVRAHNDGIQMRAEVPCSNSDAVMYWRGTVRGNEIEGSFTWVNRRWYWTFEKEFSFKGRLIETNNR